MRKRVQASACFAPPKGRMENDSAPELLFRGPRGRRSQGQHQHFESNIDHRFINVIGRLSLARPILGTWRNIGSTFMFSAPTPAATWRAFTSCRSSRISSAALHSFVGGAASARAAKSASTSTTMTVKRLTASLSWRARSEPAGIGHDRALEGREASDRIFPPSLIAGSILPNLTLGYVLTSTEGNRKRGLPSPRAIIVNDARREQLLAALPLGFAILCR